jgi:hypothetical protein
VSRAAADLLALPVSLLGGLVGIDLFIVAPFTVSGLGSPGSRQSFDVVEVEPDFAIGQEHRREQPGSR